MREQEFYKTQAMHFSSRMSAATSETYLRALIENCPIAIVALDSQHRFTLCNPAFERLFQYQPKELAAADLDFLIASPEQLEEAAQLSQTVLVGNNVHMVTQRRRRDGMLIDVEIYGIPLIVEGKLEGVYGLYQDITERNNAKTEFQHMVTQLENLQQQERRRIARDLHDSTSQELAVLNWNLARLRDLIGDSNDDLKNLIEETKEIAYRCSACIRSTSYLLHPPLLGEAGLRLALPWLAEGFEERSGIRVDLKMSENLGRYQDEIEIAIYRIVQEALANVLRHSGSATAKITLQLRQGWLKLAISDRGKGLAPEALSRARSSNSGVGIGGMRERVEQLGGLLTIDCNNKGTTVKATIPSEITLHG